MLIILYSRISLITFDEKIIGNETIFVRGLIYSLDIDLNRVQTKSKTMNAILHTFGFLKFPMPTLKYRNGEVFIHPLFF